MDQIGLELERVLQADAADILAARYRASIIHHTRDIDAAGDEVEQAVRNVLRRKLPAAYYVGHGHIVDERLATSSQLDVIVANNTRAPILFHATNGTEYFPYESVYAIGEVKTSYQKRDKPIQAFVERLLTLQTTLSRDEALPFAVVPSGDGASYVEASDYGNPLFAFMLFADSNDFDVEQVREFYVTSDASTLPNVVCFLDKGVLVYADVRYRDKLGSPLKVHNMPKFHRGPSARFNQWVFNTGPVGGEQAYSFGSLYYMLMTHLGRCVLKSPNLLTYLQRLFGTQGITYHFGREPFVEDPETWSRNHPESGL